MITHNRDKCPTFRPADEYSDLDEPDCEVCILVTRVEDTAWGNGFTWGLVRAIQAACREGAWTPRELAEDVMRRCAVEFFCEVTLNEVQLKFLEEVG